jgi:hypothetical protein
MAHGKCSLCPTVGRLKRDWCTKHYQRWRAHGDPLWEPPPRDPSRYDSTGHYLHANSCPSCGNEFLGRTDQVNCSPGCSTRGKKRPGTGLSGEAAPNWGGENVGYWGMHNRVYRERGKADYCVNGCVAKRYDWASLIDEPKTIWDFEAMCRSCHRKFDAKRDRERDGFQGHPCAKLTADIVREARELHARGMSATALARAHGVTPPTMQRAIDGETWGWLT